MVIAFLAGQVLVGTSFILTMPQQSVAHCRSFLLLVSKSYSTTLTHHARRSGKGGALEGQQSQEASRKRHHWRQARQMEWSRRKSTVWDRNTRTTNSRTSVATSTHYEMVSRKAKKMLFLIATLLLTTVKFDPYQRKLQTDADTRCGYPRWDGSDAQRLLKLDMNYGKHNHMQPSVLHKSQQENQKFPLKVFRDHIHQEIWSRNQKSYWLNREQKEKKWKFIWFYWKELVTICLALLVFERSALFSAQPKRSQRRHARRQPLLCLILTCCHLAFLCSEDADSQQPTTIVRDAFNRTWVFSKSFIVLRQLILLMQSYSRVWLKVWLKVDQSREWIFPWVLDIWPATGWWTDVGDRLIVV